MISIIGAGPVGSYLAYLLAREGREVTVYEEHNQIGKPIQCTGLITNYLTELMDVKKEFLVNVIKRVRVFSPNGEHIEVKLKDNYVVDRQKFDSHIANMATDAGADCVLNARFLSCRQGSNVSFQIKENGEIKEKKSEFLIGADGPFSQVGKSVGLLKKRKYITAVQARMAIESDHSFFDVYLGYGDFGWLVPEDEKTARVGIVAESNGREHFNSFIKKIAQDRKIIEFQSGMIPVFNPKAKTSKGNVFLVGDAAAQVKKSTHGGIILGMIAAQELSKVITTGKGDYDAMWKKRIGKDLWHSLLIYDIMSRFSEKDHNALVRDFNNEKIKKILYEHERDFPSKMALKMLLAKPSLLKYALKLL